MSRSVSIPACVFCLALASASAFQSQTTRFVAGVDVIEMDVSVLDKDHHPVRGLKPADFTILEDGKPQKIVAFSAESDPPPAVPTAPWMRDVPADVENNDVAAKHLFVILIDQAAGMGLGDLVNAKKIARQALTLLGDGDLAAVLFSWDSFNGHSFTGDRRQLLGEIDSMTIPPVQFTGPDCRGYWLPTNALLDAVDALASVPHRRKTVIYVSLGVNMPLIGSKGNLGSPNACEQKAQDSVSDIFALAHRTNVNIYSIDPSREPPGTGWRHQFLMGLSENTGGRWVIGLDEPDKHVPAIIEETRAYYLIGYELAERKQDGTFHRVEVKVDRPGVEVHARKIRYDAVPKKPAPGATPPKPNDEAVGEYLPKTDIWAEASVAPFGAFGATNQVLVALSGRLPALSSPASRDRIDLLIRAFTPDGRAVGAHQELIPVVLSPSTATPAASAETAPGPGFELASRIELKPGRYSLRIAIHSALADKAGSVYTDVVVPDFAKEPLSLSGVVLSSSSGSSLRGDALTTLVQTTTRVFETSDRIQAFLRVYQGGTNPLSATQMKIRIVDEHNAAVVNRVESLPATAFTRERQADFSVRLPLSSLKPGEYWLAIEATRWSVTARRDVRFTVR
jgi:VWFA-related protein